MVGLAAGSLVVARMDGGRKSESERATDLNALAWAPSSVWKSWLGVLVVREYARQKSGANLCICDLLGSQSHIENVARLVFRYSISNSITTAIFPIDPKI